MRNRFIRTAYAVFQISLVLFAYLWYRQITYRIVGKGKRRPALDRVHEKCAARLLTTFGRLRGAYIKLGQFLSTQAVLPAPYLVAFSKLQDQVEPVPFFDISATVHREWGPGWRDRVKHIDESPLAAASIAQVHRARLADGREVVLKVQYPGIDELFRKDLRLIAAMYPKFMKAIEMSYPELRTTIDRDALVRELFTYIERELDYENEVANQKKMAALFADWKSVIVPDIVEDLCTRRLICMSYVEGERILDYFDRADQDGRDLMFETLMDFSLYTMVVKGLFQADSHPGNFLVTPDEKLVVLDFGCIKELQPAFRKGVIEMVQAYLNRDTRAAAELIWSLGFRTMKQTVDSLEMWVRFAFEITDTILSHFKEGHDVVAHMQDNLVALSKRFFEMYREHSLAAVPEEYVLLGRALATPPVPFDKYKPRVDVLPLALEHLAEASAEEERNASE